MNESGAHSPQSGSAGHGDAESLATLLQQACAGDEQAIAALVQEYRNYLLLIANQELTPQLKAKLGASDVVQESLMHAQQNFAAFQGASEAELMRWLRVILLNDLRKQQRRFATDKRDIRKECPPGESRAVSQQFVDEHLTPQSTAIEQEKVQLLFQAMSRLTDDHQTVIRLRNFEELEFQEIGRRMNRSADAVRKLWARAIESLREMFGPQSSVWLPEKDAPQRPESSHGD